jgi:hypothetical protein
MITVTPLLEWSEGSDLLVRSVLMIVLLVQTRDVDWWNGGRGRKKLFLPEASGHDSEAMLL